MYKLTSTEIKEGVLCTDLCTRHLRKENDELPRLPLEEVTQFKKELAIHTPSTIEYEWNGYVITITKGSSYSILINNVSYSFSSISMNFQEKLLAFITDDDSSKNAGKENNILVIFKDNKKLIEIPSVAKEVVVFSNRVFYIGEYNEGYHHYTTLYEYIVTSDTSPHKKSKAIFHRQHPSETLHLASDQENRPYLAISTYDNFSIVYRIEIGAINSSLYKAHDAYYIGNETDYASIIHVKPSSYAIASNGDYVIEMVKGVSILKYKNKKLLEILGWIDPLKTGFKRDCLTTIPDCKDPLKTGFKRDCFTTIPDCKDPLKTGFQDFLVRPIDRPAYLYSKGPSNRNPLVSIFKENHSVSIITVSNKGNSIEKTLIVFYGSYGLRTRTIHPYQYWAPLLSRGWRICFVLTRGGGDNGAAWAMKGRKSYHNTTIDDVVNSIKLIQRTYKCLWEKTAIYARSAGGIPAGVVTLMGLVGISFMEHPFVDVIETMSNPALPLTSIEYGEFGNPAMREVKKKMMEVSPMDCLKCVSPAGSVKTRVLMRTGERDTQVYPYEPLKFVGRLRELGHEVFLASEKNEGHFYGGDAWLEARARDLVLLNSWADGEKISRRDIKMAKTHRNKNSRRNKNSMRNKNKNKNMDGGKRRKSRKASRRTRRRVGRKH
jgi:hypothetical protein